ncbi:MAG: hypothetical protein RAP41_04025 [Candidatus Orphnella occulta]|nr:hypothetical protein [Candidatus Orphnella occulta]MDP8297332.1 hypothetical protein [Candidatus Orphnella occulta]
MKIAIKLMSGFVLVILLIIISGHILLSRFDNISLPLQATIPYSIKEIDLVASLDCLADTISYYDEVLTQSARNYAFT